MRCPSCGGSDLERLVPRDRIAAEIDLRRTFFEQRIDGRIDPAEQKDRVDVTHGASAQIFECQRCSILVRDEDESPRFEEDRYPSFVMERMLRAHIDAFRKREASYRSLLPPGAQVIEIGSYVGGFLHVAAEWGWRATGVDVGIDTAHFSRAHGYPTRSETLEHCRFDDRSLDGVFVWNCFEQIADPHLLLDEIRRITKPRGVLVIRTPNARFYRDCQSDLLLGHANLLGFPHLYGYDEASLRRLVEAHGFESLQTATSAHIPPSLRPLNASAMLEAERLAEQLATSWLESTFRRPTS